MKVYKLIDKWLWRDEPNSIIEIWNRHIVGYIFRGNKNDLINHIRFNELAELDVTCFQSYRDSEDRDTICINVDTEIEFKEI